MNAPLLVDELLLLVPAVRPLARRRHVTAENVFAPLRRFVQVRQRVPAALAWKR